MPKPTFYNLNEEKREKLIEAAKEEFSRVSLYEASISNILKKACIPRGSFYQYFEDKEDAFFYLLNEHAKDQHENFLQRLRNNEGDMFKAMADLFYSALIHSQEEGQNNYLRNVLLNKNYKIEKEVTRYIRKGSDDSRFTQVSELVDMDGLNIKDTEQLYHVFEIVIAITFHNLVQCLSNDYTIDEAMLKYKKEMNIIQTGLH
ncbi:TetR family transcriptional regulator [Pontibacillus sp. ALD_SL1]|uniref:TetR/AcrR family transcriptional regulator n=1 Tax=Pontibacillus sp. ALD_SL1 TaxID=2777185 RepID=UPI001A96B31B|nr:TetR/AcrR family transcriptional regulator [Pontibacillus sp. ALD_SL1]QST01174.1 TetR family transcriptional regulator [Pontibacillus sp. ALD_SL1]